MDSARALLCVPAACRQLGVLGFGVSLFWGGVQDSRVLVGGLRVWWLSFGFKAFRHEASVWCVRTLGFSRCSGLGSSSFEGLGFKGLEGFWVAGSGVLVLVVPNLVAAGQNLLLCNKAGTPLARQSL